MMISSSISPRLEYPHRVNHDGTLDSICPRCYLTIATSTWEADLERAEALHVCADETLTYFERQRSIRLRTEDLAREKQPLRH